MIYELMCIAGGIRGRREISRVEFEALRADNFCLRELLSIEENYNGLLDRYIAMQREIVTTVLHVELHHVFGTAEFQGFSQWLAREAACVLFAGRQYADHTAHSLAEIARLGGSERLPYRAWCAREYDTRLGYRAIEAIRNAAQHRMLPSHGISIGGGWVDEADGRTRRQSGSLRVVPRMLMESPKFKRSVGRELMEKAKGEPDESLDLTELVRDHLTGIAVIHGQVRDALKDARSTWERRILHTLNSWRNEFGDDTALTACARTGNHIEEKVRIAGDYLVRLGRLGRHNWASRSTFDFRVVC